MSEHKLAISRPRKLGHSRCARLRVAVCARLRVTVCARRSVPVPGHRLRPLSGVWIARSFTQRSAAEKTCPIRCTFELALFTERFPKRNNPEAHSSKQTPACITTKNASPCPENPSPINNGALRSYSSKCTLFTNCRLHSTGSRFINKPTAIVTRP